MHFRHLNKAIQAIALVALTACGSDSTGPGDVSPDDALRSLARGFSGGSGASLPLGMSPTVLGNARSLGLIDVTIDGAAHRMYALGSRVTYPSGTCLESLVVFPPSLGYPPGCTSPPLSLVLVLWQTTAGSRPPERLVVITADVGTVDFGFEEFGPLPAGPGPSPVIFIAPAFGIYISDREELWASIGGSLTSQVTTTGETCAVTPPPFAKSSTCNFATFDETGSITFEKFDFGLEPLSVGSARQITELVIPRQTILGIVQAITEIQPIVLPAQYLPTGF